MWERHRISHTQGQRWHGSSFAMAHRRTAWGLSPCQTCLRPYITKYPVPTVEESKAHLNTAKISGSSVWTRGRELSGTCWQASMYLHSWRKGHCGCLPQSATIEHRESIFCKDMCSPELQNFFDEQHEGKREYNAAWREDFRVRDRNQMNERQWGTQLSEPWLSRLSDQVTEWCFLGSLFLFPKKQFAWAMLCLPFVVLSFSQLTLGLEFKDRGKYPGRQQMVK